jgi:hypothetical protein
VEAVTDLLGGELGRERALYATIAATRKPPRSGKNCVRRPHDI